MKKAIIYFIWIPLLFCSCKKYLDEPSTTSYAYPTTLSNLQALLDNPILMNEAKTPSLSEASSDDYFVDDAIYNSADQTSRQVFIWGMPLVSSFNDWRFGYISIATANVCLEEIDKIQKTSYNMIEWNNIKGSALFYRAYYFLQLVWTYSKAYDETTADTDLGIVLRKSTDINEPSIRSTVRESYEQIIDDAIAATAYLPETSDHPLRPSKVAAFGLLARAYLSMREYGKALFYSNSCLKIRSDLIDYNGDQDLVPGANSDNSPFKKYNKEIIFYTETSTAVSICLPLFALIDSSLYLTYSNTDLRKRLFFKNQRQFKSFRGSYTQNNDRLFSGIATDEIILIRAECFIRANKIDSALIDLNRLLKYREAPGFIPISGVSSQQTLNIILLERRKELVMRDLRWMDIKRLNKEGANIYLRRLIGGNEVKLVPNDNRFALPLPQDIIQLTGMPQNPR